MNCTLCSSPLISQADSVYFICNTCGGYVMNNKLFLSPEEEKKRYKQHNNDVENKHYQAFTSPITHAILQDYKPNHIGLDYGCGTGPVITKMLSDNNYQINLFDPFFHPSTEALTQTYDYIFSCEVFEHFHQPKKEIESLLTILKPNGRIYIMTHLYDKKTPFAQWYYRKDPTHVFIYTKQTMTYIANTFHLLVNKMEERITIFQKK